MPKDTLQKDVSYFWVGAQYDLCCAVVKCHRSGTAYV